MNKTKTTRTLNPIHFEDLDPHRFEDLIRELIYDYKDWQSIEATGRSGSDSGFDIRAYEKVDKTSRSENEDEELEEELHPMEGNLWMIQCKREKTIGPKRVKQILAEIVPENSPYGYILAASANFSKESYDIFREELRKKGVMEFYLWGKAELEDLLHLPKNDRILFTFFGISLVSRRKSRATEIRQVVINKNKLYRILGETPNFHQPILLRDSKDAKYPYKAEYKDFKERPRWREYNVVEYHPWGLIICLREYFAYFDAGKKEYDYTEAANLLYRKSDSDEDKEKQRRTRENVEDYWEHLPRRNQARFFINGLVRYDEMLVIDDKGDDWHRFPHIFVDFDGRTGPIAGALEFIKIGDRTVLLKDFKHIKKFPALFQPPKVGRIYEEKGISLNDRLFSLLKNGNDQFCALYDIDGKYNFLKQKDIIAIDNKDTSGTKYYLQITHTESIKVKDYLKNNAHLEWDITQQIGRKPEPEETINVHEFKKTYDFVINRKQ